MAKHIKKPEPTDGKAFTIAGWRVDPPALCISNELHTKKLQPKTMAVLSYLASKSGTVVSRQELEESIWRGTIVGYYALSNTIIKLRKAFGDKARDPHIIETISKTGYRVIAEVNRLQSQPKNRSEVQVRNAQHPLPPGKPSIAVLSFDNMNGDADQDYFSDGISEDITTDLSKLSGLLVIARNSAFAYRGAGVNVASIGQELGVQYVLEGSVRRCQHRVRINAQMIDCTTGSHIWAERYDRDLVDIFTVQDDVTRNIVTALTPALIGNKKPHSEQRDPRNFVAYDYFLKGREQSLRDNEQSNELARTLLEKAIELDPSFSNAYAQLGRSYGVAYINNWGDPAKQSLETGLDLGRKAVALDENNPEAHFTVGITAFWLKKNKLALQEIQTALRIDPNFAEGYGALSMIQVFSGKPAKALESLKTTMRLDPHYRDIYLHFMAQAYFHLQQYSEAVDALKRRLIRKPDSDISHVLLAATYGHLGEYDQSRTEWQTAICLNPHYSIEQKRHILPYQDSADFEHFADGLRKAGLLENN